MKATTLKQTSDIRIHALLQDMKEMLQDKKNATYRLEIMEHFLILAMEYGETK